MIKTKICGLMNKESIEVCVQCGVTILGFIVDYPIQVPWSLTASEAKELIKRVPPNVKTCVVTGGSPKEIIRIAKETNPDLIQLHYKESISEIIEIASKLKRLGIETIKALRINSLGKCDFEIQDPILAVKSLEKTGISAILVDAFTGTLPGGTGIQVNLQTFQEIKENSSLPTILAGGLNPSNILSILQKVKPDAIDVLTGVEIKPGKKDPDKIRELIQKLQGLSE